MKSISYQELLDQEARAEQRRRHPLRLILGFLAVFFALQYIWDSSRGTLVERAVIDHSTVAPAAWMIGTLWPEQEAMAKGHSIVSPLGKLNILNGCEGVEVMFLLVAAFIVYPFPWRTRLAGIGLGILWVFGLNQVRIITLWQTFLHNKELFGVLHGTVLPLVMVAACLVFFLFFIYRHDPQRV